MIAPLTEQVPCVVCGSNSAQRARLRVPRDEYAVELGLPNGRSSWVVCERCGLVFQSPRPGTETVEDLYEGGTYHETRGGVPEHYIQYSLRRSQHALDWILSHPALAGRHGRALDIGCGVGGALTYLAARGWDTTGVEPDVQLGATGRSRFQAHILGGMFDDTTFPPGTTFDLAYSCHVWEHLSDPIATSRAAHALLAPTTGILAIVVPTFRKARTLAWACFTAPHTYMFTDISLGNVLRATGFEPLAHRYVSGADSELWMLARAVPVSSSVAPTTEVAGRVQRELALVPLRMPLGVPARLAKHVRTLAHDPKDFAGRLWRWSRYQSQRAKRALTSGR